MPSSSFDEDDAASSSSVGDLESSLGYNNNNSTGKTNKRRNGGGRDYDHDDDEEEEEEDSEKKERFVQRETRCVFLLRVVVICVLCCAGIAVSVVIYLITEGHQTENLQADYDAAASKVTDTFLDIALDKLGAAGSLVVAMVAHGVDHTESWPFVTLSSFQQRSATVKQSSGALFISMNPIVYHTDRQAWEHYAVRGEFSDWYQQGLAYQKGLGLEALDEMPQVRTADDANLTVDTGVASHIYTFAEGSNQTVAMISPQEERYLPAWETSPVMKRTVVNRDIATTTTANEGGNRNSAAITSLEKHAVVLDRMEYARPGYADDPDPTTAEMAFLLSHETGKRKQYQGDVFTNIYFPIYSDFTVSRYTVGVMRIIIHWAGYFRNVLPSDTVGILFVLDNSCDEPYTYMIRGEQVVLLGRGDLHDAKFDDTLRRASFNQAETIEDGTKHGLALFNGECPYSIRVYQTDEFQARYYTKTPVTITVSVAVVFFFTVLLFLLYDRLVERRQSLILKKATQTHDIVASLFPKNVRDRLLADNNNNNESSNDNNNSNKLVNSSNHRLKTFLNNGKDNGGAGQDGGGGSMDQNTIADLFPQCTVFFADISGFTAWSSSRDPAQVFVLLQNLYKAFDTVARRRRVFKVETIGDSYVAVTGLPDPQEQHAVIMCRFAAECLGETVKVTRALETTLGPDTGDLSIRIGLHSGPVTAGVLCGERSRFQLFGDTVNTAARMESTGVPGRIQASKATVDLLIAAGKEHWATTREDDVVAKGKGVLSTFWITPLARKQRTSQSGSSSSGGGCVHAGGGCGGGDEEASSCNAHTARGGCDDQDEDETAAGASVQGDEDVENAALLLKQERLVDWMVQILQEQILPIAQRRAAATSSNKNGRSFVNAMMMPEQAPRPPLSPKPQQKYPTCSLDEVVEVIELASFDHKAAGSSLDGKSRHNNKVNSIVEMDGDVKSCLRSYVSLIACAYRNNPFHNFEHACHVTMNVVKFLKRIVSTEVDNAYTHGLNSDPIVVLAIVFSALVHDVDHRGISNEQLMKEEPAMAACFKHTSVAEQNSLQLAFDLFMTEPFKLVRDYIFANSSTELARFRQVLVNVVLATDIFDKELNALRKARWNKAFFSPAAAAAAEGIITGQDHKNRMRATIVMEHIMQASDVCHTMQHWHIYRKWNKRLFFEMLVAKRDGRMNAGSDPAAFWYEGEIGFFDNYVIPLAKKLEDCKVFGVSSHECLNYAICNRNEWEARGQELVEEMLEEFANSDWSRSNNNKNENGGSSGGHSSSEQLLSREQTQTLLLGRSSSSLLEPAVVAGGGDLEMQDLSSTWSLVQDTEKRRTNV